MPDVKISDAAERLRALDPAQSFIVQAPAGSGKTELLAQRYLALLARVESPEEVVAITFTNKAAQEMRSRVLLAIAGAHGAMPHQPHQRVTWELARALVEHDRQRAWQIEANPGRLRIQTIDSLCATLTRQMPLLARFGAQPAIADDAEVLYRAAARNTLAELENDNVWSPAVERLLGHLDNNLVVVSQLLATMLARRDQWLRHVADRHSARIERASLELALSEVIAEALTALAACMPRALEAELTALARYAADNLRAAQAGSDIVACLDLVAWPGSQVPQLPLWRGIAELLLTKSGEWRKQVSVSNGFPAPSDARDAAQKTLRKNMKERMGAMIGQLSGQPGAGAALHALRELPPPAYSDSQWALLQSLVTLLPLAVAQLRLTFQEHGQVDFTEIAQAALLALGEPEQPTDLALALDYRLHHILVDEFQDTSLSQYGLLERLTAGWTSGDGRTLFAVGDPMQSIYRFREAEVGLYLRARREGIGGVRLTPLTLRVNFRSQGGVVDWVNRTFSRVLPLREDVAVGAVPYSPSDASRAHGAGVAVQVHPLALDEGAREAHEVVRLVAEARREFPAGKVAILVRSRGHLVEIVPQLKAAGLRFRAIEIERLGDRQAVQDVLALTRALVHPADRVAWLACLRAPWCGLSLADLLALCGDDAGRPLWDGVCDAGRVQTLSADGQQRLRRVSAVLQAGLAQRRRRPLRTWVEGVWLALGGPACVADATDLEDVQVFFQLLEELDEAGDLVDFAALAAGVERLYALPDVDADDGLQVMTIHKAKGLEFDVVIVPGLARTPPPPKSRLLLWQEIPRTHERSDLLLAPIRAASDSDDPIYRFLRKLDEQKARHENGRLLYVAATRARQRLHLLGQVRRAQNGEVMQIQAPPATSLLAQLWPEVETAFVRALSAPDVAQDAVTPPFTGVPPQTLLRLPLHWTLPPPPAGVAWGAVTPVEAGHEAVEFVWAGETAKHIGSVVHRWLLRIANDGAQHWSAARVQAQRPAVSAALAHLGVPPDDLERAAARVQQALSNSLADARGRWLLDAQHREARSEYALTAWLDGRAQNVIIDRTFVDEHDQRWIVDYKTSTHEGGGLDVFLAREQQRYRAQLENYAQLLALLDKRPIRLGLYFPLLQGWREWGAGVAAARR
jgi:ATP-dependent exoDNAse (exonuclease V) beta subunit